MLLEMQLKSRWLDPYFTSQFLWEMNLTENLPISSCVKFLAVSQTSYNACLWINDFLSKTKILNSLKKKTIRTWQCKNPSLEITARNTFLETQILTCCRPNLSLEMHMDDLQSNDLKIEILTSVKGPLPVGKKRLLRIRVFELILMIWGSRK